MTSLAQCAEGKGENTASIGGDRPAGSSACNTRGALACGAAVGSHDIECAEDGANTFHPMIFRFRLREDRFLSRKEASAVAYFRHVCA